MAYVPAQRATENVPRGTIFALAVVPLGIIAWVLLWSLGFIASFVAFGVSFGAVALYRIGSGGVVGRTGAIRVAVITVVTLALAIFAGLVSDVMSSYVRIAKTNVIDALFSPKFWSVFQHTLSEPGVIGNLAPSLLISVAFAALGCFSVIRGAFRTTAPGTAAAAPGSISPTSVPPAGPVINPPSSGTLFTEPDSDPKK